MVNGLWKGSAVVGEQCVVGWGRLSKWGRGPVPVHGFEPEECGLSHVGCGVIGVTCPCVVCNIDLCLS